MSKPTDDTESSGILLVDVEQPYRDALASWSVRHGLGQPERERLAESVCAHPGLRLCVASIRGNNEETFERVRSLVKRVAPCPVVVLSLDTGVDLAIRLLRLGVAELIELPSPREDVAARAFSFCADIGGSATTGELIGQSSEMIRLRSEIADAARVDSTVLLQGETGTGKGLVARLIHEASSRRDGEFVHVDCAALSPTLIESELFGHEKGSFTGAGALRRGRFEIGNDGTVFLDEIGDLDKGLQTKLLRVLQDRRYERVGGSRTLIMQARVVAATSHDLLQAVREGRFRQDLYFRLNVLKFTISPLRERLPDLPLLVQSGLRRLSASLGVPAPRVSEEFCTHLTDYDWPGNVRELMNLLERLLVQRRVAMLDVEDLEGLLDSASAPSGATQPPVGEPDDVALMRAALVDTGGNIARAARRLCIARGTLRYRIRKYGLGHLVPKD